LRTQEPVSTRILIFFVSLYLFLSVVLSIVNVQNTNGLFCMKFLSRSDTVDENVLQLLQLADPLPCTFHRGTTSLALRLKAPLDKGQGRGYHKHQVSSDSLSSLTAPLTGLEFSIAWVWVPFNWVRAWYCLGLGSL
jgi:hypothetical protein